MTEHRYDRYNLRQVILEEAKQFQQGFDAVGDKTPPEAFTSLIVSGMGGSALPANILRVLLNDIWSRYTDVTKRFPIYQNRFYFLPSEADENALNLICSHSGNTEETLASLEEAVTKGYPTIGISSGGKIEAYCQEHDILHIKLPIPFDNFQPRMATGHFIGVFLKLLINAKVIPDISEEIFAHAEHLETKIKNIEEQGKKIAANLKGKTPVIYASTTYKSLAMIWKIKINENAKTPAFWNYFPELNHNEMVGFTNPQADFSLILLKDEDDYAPNKKRYEVLEELFQKRGIDLQKISMSGDAIFTKVFETLYLGDWVSYYLALEYQIDPTPVDMVEDFKKKLV